MTEIDFKNLSAEWLRKRQSEAAREKERMLRDDCPDCNIYGPVAEACSYYSSSECKHLAEVSKKRRTDRLVKLGAPQKAAREAVYMDLRPTAALRLVQQLIDGKGMALTLAGKTGSGKTVAACYALDKVPHGAWMDAPDALPRPVAGDFEADSKAIRRWQLTPFLVIDDLGAGDSLSDYSMSRLTTVLHARMDKYELPTLITTNLDAALAKEKIDSRVISRLNGDPLGWSTVTTQDMRE